MNTRHCLIASFLLGGVLIPNSATLAAERGGALPKDQAGRTLNLNFETGDLTDWKAEGDAFARQPIKGDTVFPRRSDMRSNHEGDYWIGGYERGGDAPTGSLTSATFKITAPFASFLVAGGPHTSTAVELFLAGQSTPFFRASGEESEVLKPVVVDLGAHAGKEMFIRLVDQHTGHWGHLNFDDFRFHAEKPTFKDVVVAGAPKADEPPPVDQVLYAGLSAEKAAEVITAPAGFAMKAFAAEPDVVQPIAFALDDRGRVWVAEGLTYPRRAPEGEGKDRILIFEDTNGDHQFDKKTVFMEGLNLVSGLEVGFGGVYVGAAPYLLFIADKDGDDRPDGKPEVLLDGWGYQDTHETLNTFTWGPDGWLYGCHGVFTHSNVGKPGAPDSERTRINAGIFRYHPVRRDFEVFAEGTSNPWGIDFDENGQCFIEACVIPHLFHVIQGARYERQAGQHFNPFTYDDIKNIADHVHYAGAKGPHAGNNRSDAAGGGHAHAGLMIYQGGAFPKEFDGKIFMNNIHGQRLNMDIPERRGSGFVGRHGKDFLNFNDKWSQVLDFTYDQDGSVYIIDWYDPNQCHHNNPDGHDRGNGRIFKLVYGDSKPTKVDLQKKSSAELVALQRHSNEFHAGHARRILQERGSDKEVHTALRKLLDSADETPIRLRALWALHATGGLEREHGLELLDHADELVRAWTIQLLAEGKNLAGKALTKMGEMARQDPSPVVRLYLASAMLRTPPERRWDVLEGLLSHAEDAKDHNLPLMYWYATEGAVASDSKKGIQLLAKSKINIVRQYITRRVAAQSKPTATNQP